MKIFKIEKGGKEFGFVNSSRDTRNGFAHDCTLLIDGWERTNAHCHYLNRTWERYCYQSVAIKAIENLIDDATARQLSAWKQKNGYKALTEKRREEFEKTLSSVPYMQTLQDVKNELATKVFF